MLSRRVVLTVAGLTILGAATTAPVPAALRPTDDLPGPAAAPPGPPLARAVAARATPTPPAHHSGGATIHEARSMPPRHRGIESYVPADGHDLVLSIDDGPSEPYTKEILAILRRHRVQATFCMVGENVARYPHIAKEVAAQGHQLANHTWSHAWLTSLPHHAMVREIERAQEELDKITAAPRVFRAPFGAWSQEIVDLCWRHQMRALGWSVDPKDWSRPPTRQIVHDVLADAHPGRIILDHDGGGNRTHTVAAIRDYLPRLLDRGYRFVLP